MALVPFIIRKASPEDLATALNTALAPLLAVVISDFEIGQVTSDPPFYGRNIFGSFSSNTVVPTTTLTQPFQALVFSAPSDSQVDTLIQQYIAAHPSYFVVGPFPVYRTTVPDPNLVSTAIMVVNTQGAAAAANWGCCGSGGVGPTPGGYTGVADANYQILATDFEVELTSITASRVFTLPARSAVRAGQEFVIGDASGSVTGAITLTIAPSGTDTINGVNGTVNASGVPPIQYPYQQVRIIAGAPGVWIIDSPNNLQNLGRTAVADVDYSATRGDFLVSYTTLTATRTVTLPQAATVPPGKEFIVGDGAGLATSAINIAIAAFAGDTIDGGATAAAITYARGVKRFVRSGLTNWMSLDARNIQIFTVSGTYTKPPGCSAVEVLMAGGGNGGASGAVQAATAGGGGGGGGGSISRNVFPASSVGATEPVTVGSNGTGGAAVSTPSTNGNNGGQGGFSAFGTATTGAGGFDFYKLCTTIGGAGLAGTSAGGSGGGAGNGTFTSGAGGAGGTTATGTAGTGSTGGGAGGGGGGAGVSAATGHIGGAGGQAAREIGGQTANIAAGGGVGTNNGGNGQSALSVQASGGGGGGGGGSNATGSGGNGGTGGDYGGGGGGGAGALNGNTSGKGGDGGKSVVIVISW